MSVRETLSVASLSHPGVVRGHNEDAIFVDADKGIAILADGMGGYSGGEIASGIAVSVVSHGLLSKLADFSNKQLIKIDDSRGLSHAATLILQQIDLANQGIFEAAQVRPECTGMGTTIVVALFYADLLCLAHIGDSRCYRWRRGELQQLTRDHSLLQEQLESGVITAEQAKNSLHKNLLTKALGIESTVETEINEYKVEANDVYLLCSDGLTDMVDAANINRIIGENEHNLSTAATQLIDTANKNGGRDNVSVVMLSVPEGYLEKASWWQKLFN